MQLVLPDSISLPRRSQDRRLPGTDRRIRMATSPGAAKTCIVGLGDPIVDVLVKLSTQNFDQLGLERGGSVSLHKQEISDLLEQVADDGHRTK